ncbi:hypothetical protein Cgig2_010873 [Carnegiea gigantea]|uniref:Reverse transcriptase zinc-binding domain-containing protein n=1 Tax=Carnegiea gigantea TaxID=171969 RepID=A0A9Q1JN84_9CARY|nr:hypothetical protein Cgig2_010873 [Carnegiea gigantea]
MHTIENDHQTLFWKHRWVAEQPLAEVANQPASKETQDRTIAEYWQSGSGWRWGAFEGLLPTDMLNHSGIQDEIFWGKASSDLFSFKTELEILEDECPATADRKWKIVWRLKAPQKMKAFIWLILHRAILSNETRVRRGFAANPNCFNCPDSVEDTNHILRGCSIAHDI